MGGGRGGPGRAQGGLGSASEAVQGGWRAAAGRGLAASPGASPGISGAGAVRLGLVGAEGGAREALGAPPPFFSPSLALPSV